MEVEYLKLKLANEDTKISLSKDILKYIGFFQNAYNEGYRDTEEDPDFHLEWPLWLLVRHVLKEHDDVHGPEEGPVTLINLPSSDNVVLISLTDLYRMLRVFNYYDSPLLVDFLITAIIARLLPLDRTALALANPKIDREAFKSIEENLRGDHLDLINSLYSVRYHTILEVLKAYVNTYDLFNLIQKRFLPRVTSVMSAGESHIMVITSRGLMTRGVNNSGQMGPFQRDTEPSVWHQVPIQGVISVWCGGEYTMILTTKGVYACGDNLSGQLGIGGARAGEKVFTLEKVDLSPQVLSIACGSEHTLFLTIQGVYATGGNKYGQLGLGVTTKISTPKLIDSLAQENIVAIGCGEFFSLFLNASGLVFACGRLFGGTPDLVNDETLLFSNSVPTLLPLPADSGKIISVVCGSDHALLLNKQGNVYVFGKNRDGQLGLGHNMPGNGIVKHPTLNSIVSMYADGHRSFFIDKNGTLYGCGSNYGSILTTQDLETTSPIVINDVRDALLVVTLSQMIEVITCDGLYKVTPNMGSMKEPITLTSKSLCSATTTQKTDLLRDREEDDEEDEQGPNKEARLTCHFCGKHTQELLLHHKTQRLFCSQTPCLSQFRRFRVP